MTGMEMPEWRWDPDLPERRGNRLPLARIYTFAASLGNAVALSDGETVLTFSEVEGGARRVGAHLVDLGATTGRAVVVLSEKLAVVPVIIGAIWKTKAVYVPLDADNPPSRLAAQLAQLDVVAVVGRIAMLERHKAEIGSLPVLAFETVLQYARTAGEVEDLPLPASNEDTPAYIIFTSGSTGTPKGVMISERSLLDYFFNHNQVLRLESGSRVFSLAPFHFDVSIEDTILPLSLGAFVWQYRGLPVGAAMRSVLRRERITHLIAVSSLLALISDNGRTVHGADFPHLTMVMTGAEVCDPRLIDLWVEQLPRARVINAYGPTEATIVCLTCTITQAEPQRHASYPIGHPLPGVSIRIVDETGEAVADTETPGELWIGGSQVMIGYLGRPGETTLACPTISGERWYRTGDLVQRNPDGRIQYLQRIDDMVKIGGHRIQLGEISAQARAIPGVVRAAVGTVTYQRRPLIALALVCAEGSSMDVLTVRNALAKTLPAYMLPSTIRFTDQAQLTASGKSDDRGLIMAIENGLADDGLRDGPLDIRRHGIGQRNPPA